MTRPRDPEGSAESRIRDMCEARESLLVEVKQAVEGPPEAAPAATEYAVRGAGITSKGASATGLGPLGRPLVLEPGIKRPDGAQSHGEEKSTSGRSSPRLKAQQRPATRTKRPRRRKGASEKS